MPRGVNLRAVKSVPRAVFLIQCAGHSRPEISTPFSKVEEQAVAAAMEAADVIRSGARQISIREKAPSDLITDTDEAAQDVIVRRLQQHFPGWGMHAEEEGADAPSEDYCWIVDPLDGTTNFAHNLPPYAVSIALQRSGRTELGVVLDVPSRDLFVARRAGGATLNGRPLQVSRRPALSQSVIATGLPYRNFSFVDEYLKSLHQCMVATRGVRRMGAASIDLAYVARGSFDAFYEIDLRPWDIAAGMLLVEEAGGRVTDFSNSPLPYSGWQVLASNGLVHQEMLDTVEPLRSSMAQTD